jgi:hypothetical protein
MGSEGSAMLFLPPRPPVPLPARGSFVLGRSRSCDLALASPDASRRHAEIACEGGSFLLRDLGSTNGTWVNGERVGERALASGDRIDIGGEVLTFCQLDAGLEAAPAGGRAEAHTRLMERPALGACVRGSLAEIPLFAVLQMLEMGGKTGVLEVDEGGVGRARLWLVGGAPAHAETKGMQGFDAAVAIVNSAAGRFSFEQGPGAPERTIQASVTELLLEASRQLDEGS